MKIQKGFTLIELLVSFGLLAILFAISSITLSTIIPSTSQSTTNDVLISDIRTQQSQALSTDLPYGVHFETTSYTLFKGTSFSPNDSSNFVVTLDPTFKFTNVSFPGSVLIFTPGSGDVSNYVQGSDSFTLTNSQTNQTTVIRININGATY